MRVLYFKNPRLYVLFPVVELEEEKIAEIAKVLYWRDHIEYCPNLSQETEGCVFQARSRFGSYLIRIKLELIGTTDEDKDNVQPIVSFSSAPGSTFYLSFMCGLVIRGKWAIAVRPARRKRPR